jgi:hypothetical protein
MSRDVYKVLVVSNNFDRPLPYLKTFRELSTVPMFTSNSLRGELLQNHLKEDFEVEVSQVSFTDNLSNCQDPSSFHLVIFQSIHLVSIAKEFQAKGCNVVAHSSSTLSIAELKKQGIKSYLLSDVNRGERERTFPGLMAELLKRMFK